MQLPDCLLVDLGGLLLPAALEDVRRPFVARSAGTSNDVTPRFKLGQFHHQNAIAFAGCLVDGSAPPASVEDGRKALLLIQRAYEAARTGCRQQIHP